MDLNFKIRIFICAVIQVILLVIAILISHHVDANILIPILFICVVGTIVFLFYPVQRRFTKLLNETKSVSEEMKEERNRINLALQGTGTGIWDWDFVNGEFYWSDILKDMLGIDTVNSPKLTPDFFENLLHPNDREKFNHDVAKHIKTGEPLLCEGRMQHTDGHYVHMFFRGQALWDDRGKAYRLLGSGENISEHKEVEIMNTLFIKSIETAHIAFAMIDLNTRDYRFKYASPAFCHTTAYDFEKIVTSNMSLFIGPETSMADLDRIDYTLQNHTELSLKMLCYRNGGEEFWNLITLKPIYFEDIFSGYFVVLFNDLTDDIKKQNQEINRQRNESLGSLAGSVAHEINNLLMPMTMLKDIIEDELKDGADDFAIEQINTVDQCAKQAKEIVQAILTFSRKETSNLIQANLIIEVQQSYNFIKNLMHPSTVIEMHLPKDDTIPVLINTTELTQIITNLCKNAGHAIEGNGGQIDIRVYREKISKNLKTKLDVIASDFAVIEVEDNGSGIAKENLQKIFEPFYTTKEVGQGTGLGLSVVIGIVRSWGGGIDVNSTLGLGTTFRIYIPIYKDSNDFSDLMDIIEDLEDDD